MNATAVRLNGRLVPLGKLFVEYAEKQIDAFDEVIIADNIFNGVARGMMRDRFAQQLDKAAS